MHLTLGLYTVLDNILDYQLEIDDQEEEYLDRIFLDQALNVLSPKERATICLWSEGYTINEIIMIIRDRFDDKKIGNRAMCARISKIVSKLQQSV